MCASTSIDGMHREGRNACPSPLSPKKCRQARQLCRRENQRASGYCGLPSHHSPPVRQHRREPPPQLTRLGRDHAASLAGRSARLSNPCALADAGLRALWEKGADKEGGGEGRGATSGVI